MAEHAAAGPGGSRGTRFALTKFRPPALPATLVARPVLQDRLTAGARQRLTVVVGSAGAGKSVLLSSWAAARSPGVTSWLSCDEADASPVRFWTGFLEAPRAIVEPFRLVIRAGLAIGLRVGPGTALRPAPGPGLTLGWPGFACGDGGLMLAFDGTSGRGHGVADSAATASPTACGGPGAVRRRGRAPGRNGGSTGD